VGHAYDIASQAFLALLASALLLTACGPEVRPVPAPRPAAAPVALPSATLPAPAPTAMASASASAAPLEKPRPGRAEAAERVLFLATHLRTTDLREACPATLAEGERIRCLVSLRYADEVEAKKLALTLLDETGSLAGLLPEETTDDGRGHKVKLAPARPVGGNRVHFEWILAAHREYARFLGALATRAPVAFRDRPLDYRFFYTDKGGAPSAFAIGGNIGYNLRGTVNVSEEAVRDTLFHEIFHLNDGWHGGWSKDALGPLFTRIVDRCGQDRRCLLPYAPTDTTMGGKLYAFLPSGGAREYAAEIALRYFREQRLMLEGKPLPLPPFKCGPAENAEAMELVVREFFGGVDLVPACGFARTAGDGPGSFPERALFP